WTPITLLQRPDVGEPRLIIAARLHPAQVPTVAVRPRDELPIAQQFVRDDLDVNAHRAQRAAAGAEGRSDLVVGGGTEPALEFGRQLLLVQLVVAAHESEDEASVRGDDRHRLRRRRRIDVEEARKVLDRRDSGRLDFLRCGTDPGKYGGPGTPPAASPS